MAATSDDYLDSIIYLANSLRTHRNKDEMHGTLADIDNELYELTKE